MEPTLLTRTWQQTSLWKLLERGESVHAQRMRRLLEDVLPLAEAVLGQASTAPGTFTLHDPEHSYRVAERIVELVPEDVLSRLSPYEWGLALAAAYLHDIGMTPAQHKVEAHFDYLAHDAADRLDQAELEAFQEWLDDLDEERLHQNARGSAAHLSECRRLVTAYCRYRHNDWSGDWISQELDKYSLNQYVEWRRDLTMICQSHHESYRELREQRFDPKPVDNPLTIVHPRYLATLLRIADILDVDPERTPDIVFRHRMIEPGSEIYWHRDHALLISKDGPSLMVRSRPQNAYVHRAVEQMVDAIDEELRGAKWLSEITHFEIAPGRAEQLPHRWELASSVLRDIEPADGAYVYINASFRPDTDKLLALLGGIALYKSQLAAVRELLQNAFDAVRQRIAWQQLTIRGSSGNPAALTELYEVVLRMRHDDDGWWLECSDTGVGMTKTILEQRLLVSGAHGRHDVKKLSRECAESGIPFAQTGKFGIGVLSYFMLADNVRVVTRRALETGDGEPNGWRFETAGVGTFGELRPINANSVGTTVSLHLRDLAFLSAEIDDAVRGFYSQLVRYVQELLIAVPCRMRLDDLDESDRGFTRAAGWFTNVDERRSKFIQDIVRSFEEDIRRESAIEAPTSDGAAAARALRSRYAHFERLERALRLRVEEGELPDDLGRYRIEVPVFKLSGGECLGFLPVAKDGDTIVGLDPMASEEIVVPRASVSVGWLGMRIAGENMYFAASHIVLRGTAQVSVDFTDTKAGAISVDRERLELTEAGLEALRFVSDRRDRFSWLIACEASPYSLLNHRLLDDLEPRADESCEAMAWWMMGAPDAEARGVWQQLRHPVFAGDRRIAGRAVIGDARTVLTVPRVMRIWRGSRGGTLGWNDSRRVPDRVVLVRHSAQLSLGAVWDGPTEGAPVLTRCLPAAGASYVVDEQFGGIRNKPFDVMNLCSFPPNWGDVWTAQIEGLPDVAFHSRALYNRDHPLNLALDRAAVDWLGENSRHFHGDPARWPMDAVAGSRARAAALLAHIVEDAEGPSEWRDLAQKAQMQQLWDIAFAGSDEPPSIVHVTSDDGVLLIMRVTRDDIVISVENPGAKTTLPLPPADWLVEIE